METSYQIRLDRLMCRLIKEYGKILTMEEATEFMEWAENNPKKLNEYRDSPTMALAVWVDHIVGVRASDAVKTMYKNAVESYDVQCRLPFQEGGGLYA